MSRADELRAELAMAELEEAFAAAKAKKSTKPEEKKQLADDLRAAREAFRATRVAAEEG